MSSGCCGAADAGLIAMTGTITEGVELFSERACPLPGAGRRAGASGSRIEDSRTCEYRAESASATCTRGIKENQDT